MPKSAFVYNAVIFRHRLYIILYVPKATRASNLSSSPTQSTTICVRALLYVTPNT